MTRRLVVGRLAASCSATSWRRITLEQSGDHLDLPGADLHGVVLQFGERSGEHVTVGRPPSALANVAGKLRESGLGRVVGTVEIEHVADVGGRGSSAGGLEPDELGTAPAERGGGALGSEPSMFPELPQLGGESPVPDGGAVGGRHRAPISLKRVN
jgi:hypothetical protein